ncbi:MAG: tRNA pseudouridine(38-40) synthase TruA [Ginsengibacter sp.]
MPRYFIEVCYRGTNYSGFQVQQNANSIQAEVTNALAVFFHGQFELTGSSRTDAGVHALQNFFHFDIVIEGATGKNFITGMESRDVVYHLNSILPADIVIKRIFPVAEHAHCRFDATDREYHYHIYLHKDPFLKDRAYYYPFKLDPEKLRSASQIILSYVEFDAFCKKNSQSGNTRCTIKKSEWTGGSDLLIYKVISNRFLRGMVKGLVGSMLQVATGKTSLEEFESVIQNKDPAYANFSVPAHGLFLMKVNYNDHIIQYL